MEVIALVNIYVLFYASANEVSGGIMFSGRPSVRPSVRPSRFVFVDISRTVRWFYIKLGMRVYPGGIILCLDFRVTGSKVKGHSLFCEKKVLVQYFTYYETYEHVTCCEGRIWQESQDKFVLILLGQGIIGQMSLRSLHCKNILVFSYILRHIMPLYSNFSIRVQFIKLTIFWYLGVLRSKVTGSCCKNMGFLVIT